MPSRLPKGVRTASTITASLFIDDDNNRRTLLITKYHRQTSLYNYQYQHIQGGIGPQSKRINMTGRTSMTLGMKAIMIIAALCATLMAQTPSEAPAGAETV